MESCCPTPLPWQNDAVIDPCGRTLRIAGNAACPVRAGRIRCVVGNAWVTQEGDPRDHVLATGQEFVPASRGKVVVQALSEHVLLRVR